jgi:signal transduction histidine kinase
MQARGMLDHHLAAHWLALLGGLVAALVVVLTDAAGWMAVVFLLLGAAPLLLHRPINRVATAPTYSPSNVAGYWQDWVTGWYWQTDADHRLVLLKPDGDDRESWLTAQRVTASACPLWLCHGLARDALDDDGLAALAMLETRLRSKLPLDVGNLPWPFSNDGVSRGARVLAVPRLDAQGGFAGHHGVWRPPQQAVPSVPSPALADQPGVVDLTGSFTPMSEAEQEVLRYALSHDLRAPLRVVDGFARIVKEDYGRLLDRIGNDHLERILTATGRMNGMIDAILEQAQLSQAPVDRCPVDLSALAREVADEQRGAQRSGLAAPGAEASGAPVQILIEPGMHAEADPLLVRRVLDNLIGNAVKYSGKVERPRVEVGMVAATDPCVFYVRDNGAGFDMQHADKLFGLFQRLHSSKEFPGTGVGLAGVQNIVRRHGGRVWAEAVPGQGACFYFTLMASASSLRPVAPVPQGAAGKATPLTDLAGTPLPPASDVGATRGGVSVQRSQA